MRALSPLDLDALTASAGRMGRVVVVHEALTFASSGADIAAAVTERCSHLLEAPVQRVGGWNTPYPARADGRAVPARSRPRPRCGRRHLPALNSGTRRIEWLKRTGSNFLDIGEGLAGPRSSRGTSRTRTRSPSTMVAAERPFRFRACRRRVRSGTRGRLPGPGRAGRAWSGSVTRRS